MALAMLLASCDLPARGNRERQDGPDLHRFGHPEPPDSANNWLVAPPHFASAKADQAAPVFDQAAERLAKSWIAVVEKQPRPLFSAFRRTACKSAQQRSTVFGFVGHISARFVPMAHGRCTLIAYS